MDAPKSSINSPLWTKGYRSYRRGDYEHLTLANRQHYLRMVSDYTTLQTTAAYSLEVDPKGECSLTIERQLLNFFRDLLLHLSQRMEEMKRKFVDLKWGLVDRHFFIPKPFLPDDEISTVVYDKYEHFFKVYLNSKDYVNSWPPRNLPSVYHFPPEIVNEGWWLGRLVEILEDKKITNPEMENDINTYILNQL